MRPEQLLRFSGGGACRDGDQVAASMRPEQLLRFSDSAPAGGGLHRQRFNEAGAAAPVFLLGDDGKNWTKDVASMRPEQLLRFSSARRLFRREAILASMRPEQLLRFSTLLAFERRTRPLLQ